MTVKLLLGAALFVGCTSHKPLTDVAMLKSGDTVTIDGDVEAIVVQTAQGVVFQSERGYVPLGQVTRVTQTRHALGAGQGLLIGAGIGAGVGIVMGFAAGDDPPCEGFCLFRMDAGDKAALGGIALGMMGGLVGVIAGAVRGSDVIYENGESVRVTPNGPPGSVGGVTVTF